jgi:hypothetical protein
MAGIDEPFDDVVHYFGLRDLAMSDRLDRLMIEHIEADPLRFAHKLVLNAFEYYFPVIFPLFVTEGRSWVEAALYAPGHLIRSLYYAAIWALALLGCLRRRDRAHQMGFLAIGIAVYAAPYLPFMTSGQNSAYNFGALPCLLVAAAAGVDSLAKRISPKPIRA